MTRLRAFLFAFLLALGLASIVGPDICQWLEPGSLLWKAFGCSENAGGGGSGAGD